MEATEKVDLNAASSKHLTVLPGIAVDVARRIVAYRKRHGGAIHDWEELLNVNGFPAERLEEIKARAVLRLPSGQKEAVGGFLRHFPGRGAGRRAGKRHPK
jgi:transcriptional accessory protein Tex/SPT6